MLNFIWTNIWTFLLVQIKLFNKKTIIFLLRILFRCLIVFKIRYAGSAGKYLCMLISLIYTSRYFNNVYLFTVQLFVQSTINPRSWGPLLKWCRFFKFPKLKFLETSIFRFSLFSFPKVQKVKYLPHLSSNPRNFFIEPSYGKSVL